MDFKVYNVFKILLAAEVVLLFIQFWLGVSVNLYVTIPMLRPFDFTSYSGGFQVLAHITNGILVIALGASILSYGIKLENILISVVSVAALVFAVIASERGMVFALGGHYNILSLEMAISFLAVYTLYFLDFYIIERLNRQTEAKREFSK